MFYSRTLLDKSKQNAKQFYTIRVRITKQLYVFSQGIEHRGNLCHYKKRSVTLEQGGGIGAVCLL